VRTFYTDDVFDLLKGHSDVLLRSISGQMSDNNFNQFINICGKCKKKKKINKEKLK
jgi:hypothetical protein